METELVECPIRCIVNALRKNDEPYSNCNCIRENCQWWIKNRVNTSRRDQDYKFIVVDEGNCAIRGGK